MSSILIWTLLAGGVVCLVGFLFYLYRYVVRKELFPQLPKLWQADRNKFLIFMTLFLVMFSGFLAASFLTRGQEQRMAMGQQSPRTTKTPSASQGPSFDGKPADLLAAGDTGQPVGGEERVLDAQSEGSQAVVIGGQDGLSGGQAAPAAESTAPETASGGQGTAGAGGAQDGATATGGEPAAGGGQEAASQEGAPAQPAAQAPAPTGGMAAKADSGQAPAAEAPAEVKTEPQQATQETAAQSAQDTAPAQPPAPETPPEQPAAKPAETKSAAKGKGAWTVCVASYQNPAGARQHQRQLEAKGLKATLDQATVKGKLWHRVCVGRFASSREAERQAKKWEKQGLIKDAFYLRLP